jgi:hypothetical protein
LRGEFRGSVEDLAERLSQIRHRGIPPSPTLLPARRSCPLDLKKQIDQMKKLFHIAEQI